MIWSSLPRIYGKFKTEKNVLPCYLTSGGLLHLIVPEHLAVEMKFIVSYVSLIILFGAYHQRLFFKVL